MKKQSLSLFIYVVSGISFLSLPAALAQLTDHSVIVTDSQAQEEAQPPVPYPNVTFQGQAIPVVQEPADIDVVEKPEAEGEGSRRLFTIDGIRHYWNDAQEDLQRIQTQARSELQKQWERLKIDIPIKYKKDLPFKVGNFATGNVNIGTRIDFLTQPAFIKGSHQRIDSYAVNIGGSLSKKIGIGANLEAKMSFSRLMPTKKESIFTLPYFAYRFPYTADHALKYLVDGDVVRFEVNSGGSVGYGKGSELGGGKIRSTFDAGVGLSRSALFMIDFYRMEEPESHKNRIRTRILTNRNRATGSGSVNLSLLNIIDISPVSLVNQLLREIFKCNLFSINDSFTLSQALPFINETPADSIMVDYVFDLDSDEGKAAFDAMLLSLRKVDFFRLTNFLAFKNWSSDDDYLNKLKKYIDVPEQTFQDHRSSPIAERPVHRIFKGRAQTFYNNFSFSSKCGPDNYLFKAGIQRNQSRTHLTNYDEDNNQTHYIYTSSFRNAEYEKNLKTEGAQEVRNFDGLFVANRTLNEKDAYVYTPRKISDIIFAKDIRERTLTEAEFGYIRYQILNTSPEIFLPINWGNFVNFSGGPKTNAGLRYNFVFHNKVVNAIPLLSKEELYKRLMAFVAAIPAKYRHHLKTDQQKICQQGQDCSDPMLRFVEDAKTISTYLAALVASPDSNDKVERFRVLSRMSLFNDVGIGYIISLLPPNRDLSQLMSFSLSGSADDQSSVNYTYGTSTISDLYRSVQYMLGMINNRSLDLRLSIYDNRH